MSKKTATKTVSERTGIKDYVVAVNAALTNASDLNRKASLVARAEKINSLADLVARDAALTAARYADLAVAIQTGELVSNPATAYFTNDRITETLAEYRVEVDTLISMTQAFFGDEACDRLDQELTRQHLALRAARKSA